MSHPTISVIIPSLNYGRYIEQAIQSILSQDYSKIECIVVDGGSTDETINILNKYRGQIKWISELDNGQSDAINKGLKMSNGDILSFLNADDWYEPNVLGRVVSIFQKYPNVDLVTGNCYYFNQTTQEKILHTTSFQNINYSHLVFDGDCNCIFQPASFFTRRIVEKIGYFDVNLNYAMDYDYWIRILKVSEAKFLDLPIANFRLHPTSKTVADNNKFLREQKIVIKKQIGVRMYFTSFYRHRVRVRIGKCLRRIISPETKIYQQLKKASNLLLFK